MRYKKSVFRSLAMVTQLGLSVMAPIFLCIFIGSQVDSRFGVKTLVPLLVLGALAGGRCAWRLAMNTLQQDCREEGMLRKGQENPVAQAGTCKPKQPSRIQRGGRGGALPPEVSGLEGGIGRKADEEAGVRWNG